jgi:chaperonin GroEL
MKKVEYAKEARAKVLEGVRKICRAVKVTLGPSGRNVLIAKGEINSFGVQYYPLHSTKDGVTVARAFSLEDHQEDAGARLIKEAAQKTVEQAGDSTTTTCVLAEAIIEAGIYAVEDSKLNPVLVKKGIDSMVARVVDELKKMSTPISGDIKRIEQVATVSANNDTEIGKLIASAYDKIGEDGIIRLEESKTTHTKMKITDGFMFARGMVSPHFVTNPAKMVCELPITATMEKPVAILLCDRPITQMKQIQQYMVELNKQGRSLLIIAEDIDSEALALLIKNNTTPFKQGALSVCAVKAPYSSGNDRDEAMEDIAILTGATYFSNIKGKSIDKGTGADLGAAKKVIVTKDETVIIDGAYDEEKRKERLDKLIAAKANAETDEDREKLELRIARLKGAVAIIEVGANTEIEMMEKKDRIDDAIRSVRASLIDGFVPGGGTAFIRASQKVRAEGENADFKAGEYMVIDALDHVLYNICRNAGVDEKIIISDVLNASGNFGYNAQTEKIEDLVETGIIDATKVLISALTNAASVAGAIITTEATITDIF